MSLRSQALIVGAALIAGLGGLWAGHTWFGLNPPPGSLAIGAPAIEFELPTLDGGSATRAQWGGRVQVINFWAPWCRPCLSELPTIEKLYQAQNGKMEFFIISTDGPENQIRAFMKRKGYNFPAYRLVKTPQTDSLDRILPLTALSHNSEALIYHKGGANWNSEVVHQLVEELAGRSKN